MAGSMSETMRGGEPEDGDTIAEAEAEAVIGMVRYELVLVWYIPPRLGMV
jgi:hypothetical protein